MNVASITTDLLRDFSATRTENGVTGPTVNRNLAMLRRMFKVAERESKVSNIPYFPMQQESEPEFEKLRIEMPRNLRPNLLLRRGAARVLWQRSHLAMDEPLPSRKCACRPVSSRTASR